MHFLAKERHSEREWTLQCKVSIPECQLRQECDGHWSISHHMILSKDIKAYRTINQINTTNSAVSYVYSQKSKSLFINLRNNNHQHQQSTNGRNREQKNEHRKEFRSRSKLSSSPHFGLMLSMYGQKGRNRMMEAVDRSDENYYL